MRYIIASREPRGRGRGKWATIGQRFVRHGTVVSEAAVGAADRILSVNVRGSDRDTGRRVTTAELWALFGIYAVVGRLSLVLAAVHPSASAIWPPTGIALAATLLLGYRVGLAIFFGAFIVNITTFGTFATSLGIACGNTLEALVGAWLVNRFAGGVSCLDRPPDVFRFAFFAGFLATSVSVVGVSSLCLGGFGDWTRFGPVFLTWWLGDAGGALILSPAILLWARDSRFDWSRAKLVELAFVLIVLLGVAYLVFGGGLPVTVTTYPLAFVTVPCLLWAGFRFGQREIVTGLVIVTVIAICGTFAGYGPFAVPDHNASLLLLQSFMGVIAVMCMALAAADTECRSAELSLRKANQELESQVEERTRILSHTVTSLRAEIVERNRIEAALKVSEERLLEAQRVAHIGSYQWDPAADTVTWSDELYRLFSVTRETFSPSFRGYLSLVHSDDRAYVERNVTEAFLGKTTFAHDYRVRLGDGSIRWLHARGSAILDETGQVCRMIGTCHDVTERKRAEEERAELLAKEQAARGLAEEAVKSRDVFLAVASHELKTPLGALMLQIEGTLRAVKKALPDSLPPEILVRYFETADRQAKRLARLVKVLLDVSMLASGEFLIRRTPGDLVAIVRETAERFVEILEQAGCSLKLDLPDEVSGYWDEERIEQVVSNLLDNAGKYGAGHPVLLRVEVVNGEARMFVRDHGVGIPEEERERIFERLARVEDQRKVGGFGLGLYVTREIVERHGGRVWIESPETDRGSIFVVALPLSAPQSVEHASSAVAVPALH
jgi:signal transduction histidine kinase/integral membrane sensor domain MASE1